MGTKNIRDLYGGLFHGEGLRGAQALDWTDHFPQDFRGHMGIERRRLQTSVAEQDLNDPDIDLLFQIGEWRNYGATYASKRVYLSLPLLRLSLFE